MCVKHDPGRCFLLCRAGSSWLLSWSLWTSSCALCTSICRRTIRTVRVLVLVLVCACVLACVLACVSFLPRQCARCPRRVAAWAAMAARRLLSSGSHAVSLRRGDAGRHRGFVGPLVALQCPRHSQQRAATPARGSVCMRPGVGRAHGRCAPAWFGASLCDSNAGLARVGSMWRQWSMCQGQAIRSMASRDVLVDTCVCVRSEAGRRMRERERARGIGGGGCSGRIRYVCVETRSDRAGTRAITRKLVVGWSLATQLVWWTIIFSI